MDIDTEKWAYLTSDFIQAGSKTCSHAFLDNLIGLDLVQPITGRDDLDARMGEKAGFENRRMIYAFRDPEDKDRPFVFVEIALTESSPKQIQKLIAGEDLRPRGIFDTATAYSISNCKNPRTKGVSGLGRALIMRVREELHKTAPHIRHMVTLSPIPQFRDWILSPGGDAAARWPRRETRFTLGAETVQKIAKAARQDFDPDSVHGNHMRWLALSYLLFADHNSVANFHCGNGAHIDDICLNADWSQQGVSSLGLMANYRYPDEPQRENNAQSHATRRRAFCSPRLREMLRVA